MTKQTNPIPDFSGRKTFHTKLPVLISCRVRLDDDQRQTLKDALYALRNQSTPTAAPAIGGSTVTTTTAYNPKYSKFSDIVLNDIIVSRDSIALTTILEVQSLLNVEVISKKDVLNAASSYVDYVWSTTKDHV